MKKINLIIIILLSMFMGGCKKTHCPGFPSNLNYFPYSENQELKFTNSQNEFCCFTVDSKYDSKPVSYDYNCDCACEINSIFQIHNEKDINIRGSFFISGVGYTSFVLIECFVNSNESLYKEMSFEGKTIPYNEVHKYVKDTITLEKETNEIIKKAVIVKGKGLISFTKVDGEEWNLVE